MQEACLALKCGVEVILLEDMSSFEISPPTNKMLSPLFHCKHLGAKGIKHTGWSF